MSEQKFITRYLEESLDALEAMVRDELAQRTLLLFAEEICAATGSGRKLLVAGNGGSAGDAQHIAGEFVSRLFFDREPLPALALTTDSSVLTAIGNDYGYEKVFERQILGLGVTGDVFLAISTSGKSPNIVRGLQAARAKGLVTLGFTGSFAGAMAGLCDHVFCAPSNRTSVIQQLHIVAAHIVCGLVEARLCRQPEAVQAGA